MTFIGKIVVSVGLFLGGLLGYHQVAIQNSQPVFGDYNPAGGGTYRLQASIGSSDTSISLSSFKEPVSNIAYTMSYLNSSIEYGTLEPGNTTKKEFVSFTGITQNSDGTATLTGVTRGLSFAYPYTASTTLQQTHSGQSIFILSNPPQLTNQYGNLNNANTWLAVNTFTAGKNPTYSSIPATLGSNDLVPYQTLLNTAISGAATSTYSNMGISQLATNTQLSNSTASSTEGRPLVLSSGLSTTTCATTGSYALVSSSTTGKLGGACVDGTYSYTFSAGQNFTGGATSTGTTTISASNVTTNPLKLNTVPYSFPSTQGASSTVLENDGNGNLTNELQDWTLLAATTTTATMSNATTTFTASFQDLRFTIYTPSNMGGSQYVNICFNNDCVGSTYGEAHSVFGVTGSNEFNSNQSAMAIEPTAGTTSPRFIEGQIFQQATTIKRVLFRGEESSGGSFAPTIWYGGGNWNNTSALISAIRFSSNTFPVGTVIRVWGSNR